MVVVMVDNRGDGDGSGDNSDHSDDGDGGGGSGSGNGMIMVVVAAGVEEEDDGKTHFSCTHKARRWMYIVWEKALIVKLLGRTTGVTFMKKKIESFWARKGRVNIIDIGNEFYVEQFSNGVDMDFALNEGPWVLGNYLSLRKWVQAFRPNAEGISKIASWIRLPDIPLEFYDEAFFRRVGN
ncbi:uncharacterized protein LOC133309395 [Gastrolobium bilobum]|uniref:uncharacterized protein LOC133309395 n=1 Tax=Gastrolobium bilobum TaxID=150636 RepID=UPI002AB18DCD|nr:uncharacterized protein LOC133309395 [Gastrolobium bilobum]